MLIYDCYGCPICSPKKMISTNSLEFMWINCICISFFVYIASFSSYFSYVSYSLFAFIWQLNNFLYSEDLLSMMRSTISFFFYLGTSRFTHHSQWNGLFAVLLMKIALNCDCKCLLCTALTTELPNKNPVRIYSVDCFMV